MARSNTEETYTKRSEAARNARIYRDSLAGLSDSQLARKYKLSRQRIGRILLSQKDYRRRVRRAVMPT